MPRAGYFEVQEASLIDADLAAALPLVPEQHRGKIASPETLRGIAAGLGEGESPHQRKPFGWEGKSDGRTERGRLVAAAVAVPDIGSVGDDRSHACRIDGAVG